MALLIWRIVLKKYRVVTQKQRIGYSKSIQLYTISRLLEPYGFTVNIDDNKTIICTGDDMMYMEYILENDTDKELLKFELVEIV